MGFGDRFRAWKVARQTPSTWDYESQQLWDESYPAPSTGNGTQGGHTPRGSGDTIWPSDWYLGKNLGLSRYEVAKVLPGVAGKAAEILFGGTQVPIKVQPPKPDYTPLYVIAGAVVLVAVLQK